jgi:hypothetical protein
MATRKAATTRKTTGVRKTTSKRRAAKRELIDTGTDKGCVRRNPEGQFKESDDVGQSLSADRRQRAKRKAKRGQGDKGDRTVRRLRLASGRRICCANCSSSRELSGARPPSRYELLAEVVD